MTSFLPIILLTACAPVLAEPALPAPGEWHEAALPSGVLAEADIEAQTITWDRRLLSHPPIVVAAVVLHEICHLRGSYSEGEADCCAARLFAEVYGLAAVADVVMWWEEHGRPDAAETWMECAR